MMDIFLSLSVCILFCWRSVNCQDPEVPGFIGGNVTLPCNFQQRLSQENNVFWRDTNDLIVLDINGGEQNPNQDEKYKGRVFMQYGYNSGNVSIIIKNLRTEDDGTYTCRLLPDRVTKKINLRVSENPAIKTTTTGPSGGAAGTKVLGAALLSALSLLLCF